MVIFEELVLWVVHVSVTSVVEVKMLGILGKFCVMRVWWLCVGVVRVCGLVTDEVQLIVVDWPLVEEG